MQLPEQPQRHVDPRRYPRRRDEVPVAHVARVLEHRDVATRTQRLDEAPVRRDALPLREARLVQEERAGADARHPCAAGADGPQPVDDDRIVDLAACPLAAGDEDYIEARRIGERVIGKHAQALVAADRTVVLGDRHDAVAVAHLGGGGEHLPWPDEVQLLGVVEDQHPGRDAHRSLLLMRVPRATAGPASRARCEIDCDTRSA